MDYEINEKRRIIKAYEDELMDLRQRQSLQKENILRCQRSLQDGQEEGSSCLESRLNAFHLTKDFLHNRFKQLKTEFGNISEFKNKVISDMSSSDDKWDRFEEILLKKDLKKKFRKIKKQLSEMVQLRISVEGPGDSKIAELRTKTAEDVVKLEKENNEIHKNYKHDLHQVTQEAQNIEKQSNMKTASNALLKEDLKGLSSKVSDLNITLQEDLETLDHLNKSCTEWSCEFEASLNQVNAALKVDKATLEETEELLRTLINETDKLAEDERAAKDEDDRLTKQLVEVDTDIAELQQQKLEVETYKVQLTEKKYILEKEIDTLKIRGCTLDNDWKVLDEESASLYQEIEQENALNKEALLSLEANLEAANSKVQDLESYAVEVNEIQIELNKEVEKNVPLVSENIEVSRKRDLLTVTEEGLVKNLNVLNQQLEVLACEITNIDTQRLNEIAKLTKEWESKDYLLELAENNCKKEERKNNELLNLLAKVKKQGKEESDHFDRRIGKIIAESDEELKALNDAILKAEQQIKQGRADFKVIYDKFNVKYRTAGQEMRRLQVEISSVKENIDKSKKVEANLLEVLTASLKTDRKKVENVSVCTPSEPKKLTFSANLEKFSPLITSDITEKPVKPILKRKSSRKQEEAAKKLRADVAAQKQNYFPNFEDEGF